MKKYGTVLLIVLLILAVCTYVSGQVYRDSLPTVTVENAASGTLRHEWEITGQVYHETQDVYSFPVPVEILEYKFQTGQWVREGDALLKVDADNLHLQWLQCKLEEEELVKKLEKAEGYQKELLQYEYDTLLSTILEIESLIENQGWVFARGDGVVLAASSGKQVPAGTPVMTLGPASGRKQIVFPVTQLQKQYCLPGTVLSAALTLDTGASTEEIAVGWSFYSAAQQQEQCVAITFIPLNMLDGQQVAVTLRAESVSYDTVIPTSAIVSNDNGNVTFFVLDEKQTVLGTEQVVYLYSGFALEQNDTFTALSLPVMYPVVISWDKGLSTGTVVNVLS